MDEYLLLNRGKYYYPTEEEVEVPDDERRVE